MKKISLIATTVLTGLLLFPSVNDTTTHAAEVTSHDAQAVAIQAMKNSGGNPDLQNFKKVKDKGDYFTIDINNKSGAGVGTYKVYKNGVVLYKSGNYGEYSQLNTRQCYVAQDIATTSSQVKRHSTQQTQAVDSTRELNSYYVGQVQSSDLPQQSSSDMLPNTGMKDKNFNTNGIISLFLLTAGFIALYHQPLRKMS